MQGDLCSGVDTDGIKDKEKIKKVIETQKDDLEDMADSMFRKH